MGSFQFWLFVIESLIALTTLMIGVVQKKFYAFGFALTFALFAWHDLVGIMGYAVSEGLLSAAFFLAITIGALSAYLHVSDY